MMAESIKPEVLKKTQTALNKYIKKPPLTDKLLKKPPFRFLHDIVTSVIRETGFLNGVFTPEELIADNVKDKDSKIKFLTKLINAVRDSTGNNIKAKPGKIVAGLEVDRTLELLQAVAKGISNQTNGNKTVPNNQNENNKPSKDTSETIVANNKSKVITEGQGNQRSEDAKEKKKKERKEDHNEGVSNPKEKKKREKSEKREKPQKEEKQKPKEIKRRESFPSEETNPSKVLEEEKSDSNKNNLLQTAVIVKEPQRTPNEEVIQTSEVSKQPSSEVKVDDTNAVEKENLVFRHKEPDRNVDDSKKIEQNVEVNDKVGEQNVEVRNKEGEQSIQANEHKKDLNGETSLKRPSTRRASSRSIKHQIKKVDTLKEKDDNKIIEESSAENVVDLKKAKDNVKDSNTADGNAIAPPSAIERPRTARRAPPVVRPPSARPPSARPGAPKTRDRGEVAVDHNKLKEDEVKEVVLITENEKAEEDKENMVVLETQPVALDEENNIEDVLSPAEGILIDILEAEGDSDKKKQKTDIEWEGGQREKRAAWQKECDQLRAGIQALTRSTGPLGKLFDFLQEDVDLAARELAYWKQASAEYASQLLSEQRLTDELLSRHRKKLTELEGQIEEELEAIRGVKANILINDRKISSLISRAPQNL